MGYLGAPGSSGPRIRAVQLLPKLLAVLLLLGCLARQAAAQTWTTGQIATNYGSAYDNLSPWQPSYGTSVGSCGYGALDKSEWPYWSVAGIATKSPFYIAGPLNACGQCFEVQCVNNVAGSQFAGSCYANSTTNSVFVMIADSCPECTANQLDIQALTFGRLAPIAVGRVDTRIRRVNCNPPADMSINVLNGNSGSGFFKFTVQGVGANGAVQSVQVAGTAAAGARTAGPVWIEATPVDSSGSAGEAPTSRKTAAGRRLAAAPTFGQPTSTVYGAAWQMDQMPPPPLSFRVTSSSGAVATALNVVTKAQLGLAATLPLSAQFANSTALRTGAAAIGSSRYGDSNPVCPVGSFYNMVTGRVPGCTACIGFQYNYESSLTCYPPLQNPVQKAFCAPLAVSATVLDKGTKLLCFDRNAMTHTVVIKIPTTTPIKYALTDIQPKVALRSKSQTLLTASSVAVANGGLTVTFADPSKKVGALIAGRTVRSDFFYVEGAIKVGGTGQPMCFSSDQTLAMRAC